MNILPEEWQAILKKGLSDTFQREQIISEDERRKLYLLLTQTLFVSMNSFHLCFIHCRCIIDIQITATK